jgi:hypothetical protein
MSSSSTNDVTTANDVFVPGSGAGTGPKTTTPVLSRLTRANAGGRVVDSVRIAMHVVV